MNSFFEYLSKEPTILLRIVLFSSKIKIVGKTFMTEIKSFLVNKNSNLKNKILLIKTDKTNKNDIIRILGPIPVIDKKENRWAYFEVRETKTKIGKKTIYVNDYVEIYFDKYGIVKKFELYTLNNMNDIKFAKEKTKSLGVKDTFSKNLLSSTRKRMENARKKFQKK